MDMKSMLMVLNGCEVEIQRFEEPMEHFKGLREADAGTLRAYHTRKGDILNMLSQAGFETVMVRGKWWASPRGKLEGIDVLAPR